ncbi:energy transducer TonB [Flavobacterium chungnamense]|uniref:Energy transducer TonB n=1 Tax=Flavobacterium chungnamense TaxID=706182 RepID=A0ABP7UIL2_9FLAO
MSLDSTPADKRKSLIIATLIYAVLLLIMFFIRFWPPSDAELLTMAGGGGGGGVTVNFGDTDFGSGADYQSKELDVKEVSKNNEAQPTPYEDIISEDTDADKTDAVIPKTKPVKNPKPIVKPEIKKPVEVKKPVKKVDDALANILKGNKKGGDGNSGTSGNQGRANGDINSSGYSGTGGSGGGTGGGNGPGNGTGTGPGSGSGSGGGNGSGNGLGNGSGYALNGRKALEKPNPSNNCNEAGKIVVEVTVDKNGKVISAERKRGVSGASVSSCLMAEAKKAALNTKWSPSPTGAEKQVGTITYNFSYE